MSEHESVRAMLSLAAAGALAPEEIRRVEQHAESCVLCRRDLETWAVYTQGLRKLPQPSASEGLVQRTQARIVREQAEAARRRRGELLLGVLAIFGWAAGWALWILVRAITSGSLNVGANLLNGLTWSVASAVLAWTTAGTAALMLSKHRERGRFL